MKIGPVDTKKCIVTDFETYYDDVYTLRKLRTEEYIQDPRFQAHGVAVAYPTGKTEWVEGKDIPKWLKSYRKFTFVAQNMYFDGLIWQLRYNHVAPFMVDTKLLANHVFGPAEVSGGNGLEDLAERLGFQPKGKVEMFKGKRTEDLSPQEAMALKIYGTNDADLEFKVLHKLLPLISRPEFELWLMDHTLRTYITKPLPVLADLASSSIRKVQKHVETRVNEMPKIEFDFTYEKAKTVKKVRVKTQHTIKKIVDADVLASNPQFGQALLQLLKKHKIKVPMKYGKKGPIPALAKADEGFIALKGSENKAVRSLVIARLAKRSGDTQVARLVALLKTAKAGGFRIFLNYWGAHTGRWSGGSGLNPQNFPNPGRSTDDFEREVADLIRKVITPGKGNKFVAVDAANIEARVLAWWAEQQDLVDAFGDGTDVYSSFASETFGEEVRKPLPNDEKVKIIRFKLLRAAGKEAVLGLGYGMGAPKMELRMRSRPDVAPLFASGDLSTDKCEVIVAAYRRKYKKIPELWNKVEAAFFKAREGAQRMVNGVLFGPGKKAGDVVITLPSGRELNYRNVRVGEHGKSRHGKKQWVFGHGAGRKIYGGLLVENVVQAISRDILAEGIYAMEAAGYNVAYHVHDSIVCRTKTKDAKKCMNYCIEVLSEAPAWGKGMRLGAEGSIEDGFA